MKKIVYILIGITVFVTAVFVILYSNNSTKDQTVNVNVIDNKTDIEKLKSSQTTSSNFDKIELSDSLDDVEEKLSSSLTEVSKNTYKFYDESVKSTYIFVFEDNKLTDVSVLLD